jgi:four helix bundle protein
LREVVVSINLRGAVGDYRKLEVWKRAREMTLRINDLVKSLPRAERARIGDQLMRSADSIRFNIVEGCGLNTDPQLARYLSSSLGSANELQDELDALAERGLLRKKDEDLRPETTELRAMLAVFHTTVSRRCRRRRRKK